MLRKLSVGFVSLIALAAAGCSQESGYATIADPNDKEFATIVLPILLRDCGFQACHGSQERFFRVYGPGRTRLSSDPTDPLPPLPDGNMGRLTGYERDYSQQLARSMIDPENPKDSLLLRKPLAVEAGGSAHEGVDKYGRNVYRTPGDDGYLKIARWVFYVAPTMAAAQSPVPSGAAGAAALAP